MIIVHGGRRCGCGNHGCLEAYFSESAARALVEERAGDLGRRVEGLVTKQGYGYAQSLFELTDDGLAEAGELTSHMIEMLGSGIASAVNVLDLTIIVLGGGIAPAVLGRVDELREAMNGSLFAREASTIEIVAAAQGADAGALGAACLARSSR
jgi:glucokinase